VIELLQRGATQTDRNDKATFSGDAPARPSPKKTTKSGVIRLWSFILDMILAFKVTFSVKRPF
jgi:hypothetical protein